MLDDGTAATSAIEHCRAVNRRAAVKYAEQGVEPVDIAIGAAYSAHDLATALHDGDQYAAIEWARTALDTMERQLMEADRNRQTSGRE